MIESYWFSLIPLEKKCVCQKNKQLNIIQEAELMVDCPLSASPGEGLASKTIEICNACSLNLHGTTNSGYDTKLIESKLHFCASLSVVI